jgi:hypothetical protein
MPLKLSNPSYPEVMTCVYRLYDAAGRLLYVGVAYDFDLRFYTHSKQKDWWPEVAHKEITWFANRLDALHEEARAIRDEAPIHNERGGINPVCLAIFYRQRRGGCVEMNPARLLVSDFDFERALRDVVDSGHHAVITYEGVPKAVFVPTEWVERARAIVGDPPAI